MSMNVNELALRLHLRAMARRSRVDPTFGGVSFGGSCCAECQESGTSCGGDKSAPCCAECARTGAGTVAKPCHACSVSFGAVTAAPPPPVIGWPFTSSDLKAYAAYVDERVAQFDTAWANWHDAARWDNGGAGCTPDQVASLQQQIDAGQITTQQAAQTCHPEYFDQMNKANGWSAMILGAPEWTGWPMWSASFHKFAQDIANCAGTGVWQSVGQVAAGGAVAVADPCYGQQIMVQLQGAIWGDYPTLKQKHEDLISYAKLAKQMGLKDVPDPGTVAVPASTGQKINEVGQGVGNVAGNAVGGLFSGLTSSFGGIVLLAGGAFLGYQALKGRR